MTPLRFLLAFALVAFSRASGLPAKSEKGGCTLCLFPGLADLFSQKDDLSYFRNKALFPSENKENPLLSSFLSNEGGDEDELSSFIDNEVRNHINFSKRLTYKTTIVLSNRALLRLLQSPWNPPFSSSSWRASRSRSQNQSSLLSSFFQGMRNAHPQPFSMLTNPTNLCRRQRINMIKNMSWPRTWTLHLPSPTSLHPSSPWILSLVSRTSSNPNLHLFPFSKDWASGRSLQPIRIRRLITHPLIRWRGKTQSWIWIQRICKITLRPQSFPRFMKKKQRETRRRIRLWREWMTRFSISFELLVFDYSLIKAISYI